MSTGRRTCEERTVFVEWLCLCFPHLNMEVQYERFGYASVTVWAGGDPIAVRAPVLKPPRTMALLLAARIQGQLQ